MENKLIDKIVKGELLSERKGKESIWGFYASIRLMKESGQEFTDQSLKDIIALPAKWTYWNLKSNNNEGFIIIKFYIKKTKEEGYAIVNNKTGEITDSFDTIHEAKTHFLNNYKI